MGRRTFAAILAPGSCTPETIKGKMRLTSLLSIATGTVGMLLTVTNWFCVEITPNVGGSLVA